MFIIASIDKVIKSKYSYNNKATKIELKHTVVKLPTKNGKIDFAFMESFITELEAQRIAELEAYLITTGLNDYTLTEAEKQVLADFEHDMFEWAEFKIGDLFEIGTSKKRFDANKVEVFEYGIYPYGVMGFSNLKASNKGNTIS